MKPARPVLACLAALLSVTGATRAGFCAVPERAGDAACTYFVAPTGSDDNDGKSAATPFATLERAQSAARHGGSRVICLRAGTYQRTAPLALTAADEGETWRYYAPDGVDSAVLDGLYAIDIININDASNVTIDGLKLEHFRAYGIQATNTPSLTVANSEIGFNAVTSWHSAGIVAGGTAPRVTIEHNYVHDLGSQGIALFDGYNRPGDMDGSVISGNVVLRAVQRMYDGGAIYVSMHGGTATSHVAVENNYVANMGSSAIHGPYGASVIGIYLDDNASNVIVTGNVVAPPTAGFIDDRNSNNCTAILVHNGHDNHISGNILDLGDSGRMLTVVWGHDRESIAGMAGNTFTGNIVLSGFAGRQKTSASGVTGYSYFQNAGPGTNYAIRNNLYYNYAGGQPRSDGPLAGDSQPIFADPQISGRDYAIASGSPALRAPVNFAPLRRGWGPPGFVIPRTETGPSSFRSHAGD